MASSVWKVWLLIWNAPPPVYEASDFVLPRVSYSATIFPYTLHLSGFENSLISGGRFLPPQFYSAERWLVYWLPPSLRCDGCSFLKKGKGKKLQAVLWIFKVAVGTRLCTNSFKDAAALLMAACGEENPLRV